MLLRQLHANFASDPVTIQDDGDESISTATIIEEGIGDNALNNAVFLTMEDFGDGGRESDRSYNEDDESDLDEFEDLQPAAKILKQSENIPSTRSSRVMCSIAQCEGVGHSYWATFSTISSKTPTPEVVFGKLSDLIQNWKMVKEFSDVMIYSFEATPAAKKKILKLWQIVQAVYRRSNMD